MQAGRRWVALLGITVLVTVAAAALALEESPRVHTLTTAGPGGTVPAGVPVQLGWVLTNGEGQPAFHQDATFEVRFGNDTLLATTPASGHDYDGIDPYTVAFPEEGNYTVRARVADDSTGDLVQRRVVAHGTVTEAPEQRLHLDLSVPDTVRAGQQATIAANVTGPSGEPVEHTDVTIRIQRIPDRFEVFKTRVHDHDGTPTLRYAFDRATSFRVTAVAAPVPAEPSGALRADSATHVIEVEPSRTDAPGVSPPVDEPLYNARESGDEAGPYQLFGTYDPYTSVGPHGRIRLGMLTLNESTHEPARNVDYSATLLGPDDQQLFASDSLHAVDGFEYVTLSRRLPGTYHMRVDASKGPWSDHVTLEFTVTPPAAATNAGFLQAQPNASTQLQAGQAQTLPIHVQDASGTPLVHGEVDWRFVDQETGTPVAAGKLHSHENGTLPLTLTPPEAGNYRLELMPESLQPAPTPFTFGEAVGQAPVFDVQVDPPETAGEELASQSGPDGQAQTPGLSWVALGSVLAGAAALARRP